MTELAAIKLGSVVAATIMFEAVIDPSVTSITLAVIAAAVVIIPLWLKHRMDTMLLKLNENDAKLKEHDGKIAEVIKTSDGMKDALVAATGKAERAEGIAIGVAQAEVKAAIIAASEATGAAREAAKPKGESAFGGSEETKSPAVPLSGPTVASLKSAIKAVPEKTADMVVEKIKE